jgi:hypothetical protein
MAEEDRMKVDYADRELAPEGGILPEHFASYLEELVNEREAEGYRLVAVLPGATNSGSLAGAWLFFAAESADEPASRRSIGLGLAIEPPAPPPPPGLGGI